RPRLLPSRFAQGLNPDSQRSHRTRYKDRARLLQVESVGSLARQASPFEVDFVYLLGQPMPGQPERVAAKGVGFNDVGPGVQILLMNVADQVRLGNVQLVIALVDEDALGIQKCTHGAVAEDGTLFESGEKVGHKSISLKLQNTAERLKGPNLEVAVIAVIG